MSKKNGVVKKSSSLSFRTLVVDKPVVEVVEVPEFGEDATVNVKGLTVAGRSSLGNIMRQMGVVPPDENGVVAVAPTEFAMAEYQIVNAALGSYDDDGNLAFGEDPMSAVNFVRNLPGQYTPAISRISAVVTRLTTGAKTANEKTAVESAEKN